jgi:hypothetical protein
VNLEAMVVIVVSAHKIQCSYTGNKQDISHPDLQYAVRLNAHGPFSPET